MDKQIFQEVELEKIGRCPWQPRKRFDGPEFDELVRSVREKGVLQPILVREILGVAKEEHKGFPTYGKNVFFQLVAGERRFRAAWAVALENGGVKKTTIPAMVRPLTDDEAFDIMTIENLHREDLTELEEAENYKAYLDRHGMEALEGLAERTGINHRYIRRRVRLLDLPGQVLKAWGAGEISYGYLEQLNRLKDKQEILEIFKEIRGRNWNYQTVSQLKAHIDDKSPKLKWARFDKNECPACAQNSDIQSELFESETMKGAHCLDAKCFKKKQNNWFQSNWKQTGFYKQHGTNGFRFEENLDYGKNHDWYGSGSPGKKCRSCPEFVTRLKLDGTSNQPFVCIGEESCFNETKESKPSKNRDREAAPTGSEEPRVAWHGEYFRERFMAEQLPLRLQALPADDEKALRVALFALIDSAHDLTGWFCKKHNVKWNDRDIAEDDQEEDSWDNIYVPNESIWQAIEDLARPQLLDDLKEGSTRVLLHGASPQVRLAAGVHLGIDLVKEWRITKDYLDKKTMAEIHAIAEEFKLWDLQIAKAFLFEILNKKRGNFKSCKKDELVRIILESGMDLAGVVPKEITNL